VAAPVSHVVYALEYLKMHPEYDKYKFLRGTVFPDIRYVANIERPMTHPVGVTLDLVDAEADSWRAGFLFHNWVDVMWQRYLVDGGVDINDNSNQVLFDAVKEIEDLNLASRLSHMERELIANNLFVVDDEPLSIVTDSDVIMLYYRGIADMVLNVEDVDARRLAMRELGFSDSLGEKTEQMVRLLLSGEGALSHPEEHFNSFVDRIKQDLAVHARTHADEPKS
jgi:hypothetical protein